MISDASYDYLTNHGDDGAWVGEVCDEDGAPRAGVVRFDGVIDTNDLAEYIWRQIP